MVSGGCLPPHCLLFWYAQGLVHAKSLSSDGGTTLAMHQAVRMRSNGYFFQLTGFHKPLLGFKVENDGAEVWEQEEEETLSMVRNLRYFGSNPGYFTQDKTGVVVQLWHPKVGITYTCIDSADVSASFQTVVEDDDVKECLGDNSHVWRRPPPALMLPVVAYLANPPCLRRLSARRPWGRGSSSSPASMMMRRVAVNTFVASRVFSPMCRPS